MFSWLSVLKELMLRAIKSLLFTFFLLLQKGAVVFIVLILLLPKLLIKVLRSIQLDDRYSPLNLHSVPIEKILW